MVVGKCVNTIENPESDLDLDLRFVNIFPGNMTTVYIMKESLISLLSIPSTTLETV